MAMTLKELFYATKKQVNHDALAPYVFPTWTPGNSCFDRDERGVLKILDRKEFIPSVDEDTVFIEVWPIDGWVVDSPVSPEKEYTVKQFRGSLQLVGEVEEIKTPTEVATAICVKEEGKWLMAAIHPGRPDPEPNLHGLVDGQSLLGADAITRGFVRVKSV
jgi:hypothetical protein